MRDSTTVWLDTAGRYPLLTEETILLLARQVQDPYTHPYRRRRAVSKLVRHNMRLAATLTINFIKKNTNINLTDDRVVDYLQQASLGLMRAAEKFEPTKGYKFSTYANNWVRHFLQRYHYGQWSMIRVPEEVVCTTVKAQSTKVSPLIKDRVADAIAARTIIDLDKPINHGAERLTLGDIIEAGEPKFIKCPKGSHIPIDNSTVALQAYGKPVINDQQEQAFLGWMQNNNYSAAESASIISTIRKIKVKRAVT